MEHREKRGIKQRLEYEENKSLVSEFKSKVVVQTNGTAMSEAEATAVGDVKSYKVFTFPNCDKCKDTKAFLSKISLLGEAVDLTDPNGKQVFQKYYKDIRHKLNRDEHGLQLPVVLFFDKQGNVSGVSQSLETTKEILS